MWQRINSKSQRTKGRLGPSVANFDKRYEWRSAGSSIHSLLSTEKIDFSGRIFAIATTIIFLVQKKNAENARVKILLTLSSWKTCACDPAYRSIRVCNGAMPVLSPTPFVTTICTWRSIQLSDRAVLRYTVLHWDYHRNWLFLALTILHSTVYCRVPFLRNYTTYELRKLWTRKPR